MPKDYQNDAKIDAKINECSSFFKKGEKYEIKLPLGREHDFTGSGYLTIHEKSIQKAYKIDARKTMQKVWKIMPKWMPNGSQDRLKI